MEKMITKETEQRTRLERLETMLDISWLFKKVFHLWWVFLLVGIVFGLAGYFYAKSIPIKYKSHLTFALDDGKAGASGIISLASELGFNFNNGVSIFSGDNILNIIKSRHIVEDVLTSVDTFSGKSTSLIEYYLKIKNYYKNTPEKKIYFPPRLSRTDYTYQQDSLLLLVSSQFSQRLIKAERPDKRLSIYEINVTTPNEKLTKIMTDRLVANANQFYITIRTQKTKQTLDILEGRVASMKGNLNQSISERAQVEDVNVNPAFSKAQVPVLKQQSNMQVYGTAYAELFKNLELARFQYLNEMPLMQVIDEANYPMEKIQKGKLITGVIFLVIACLGLFVMIWLQRVILILKYQQ